MFVFFFLPPFWRRRPSEAILAALLGLAAGVMTTLALVDLIAQNAIQHSVFGALAAAVVGAGLYALCEF